MAAIDVRDLRKRFPGYGGGDPVDAVAGITFSVEPGERLAYIGPNGAGKSTSIKILTGILHPTAGEATVLGMVPWRQRKQLARHIGTVFGQRSQLWSQLSSHQTFSLLARIYGLSRAEERRRIAELGELLDTAAIIDRPVRTLSLGQRMRCELVASMLHRPAVLFFDEPTIGLDLVAKRRFRDLIVRINDEERTTIVLTSHDVSDIEHVAKRVIVINHGGLIYDDSVSRMRRSLLATKVIDARFDEPVDHVDIRGARLVKLTASGVKLEVDTETTEIRDVVGELLAGHHVVDLSVTDPPLDEIVSHIYSRPRDGTAT